MKQISLLAMLLLSIASAWAAPSAEEVNQKIFESKVQSMVKELSITSSQYEKFVSIYRDYDNDMRKAFNKGEKPKQLSKTASAAEVEKQITEHLDGNIRALQVQKKYIKKLSTVLNGQQLSKFLRTERKLQSKLIDRRNKAEKRPNGNDNKKNYNKDFKNRKQKSAQAWPVVDHNTNPVA